jgi:Fic family protein
MSYKEHKILLEFIEVNPSLSSKEIHDDVLLDISYATLKRMLTKLIDQNFVTYKGEGKGRKYFISPAYKIYQPIEITEYFKHETDDRKIIEHFNISLIKDVLSKSNVFTQEELMYLHELQNKHTSNIATLNKREYTKELNRLVIDMSWKSAQIEGNTYTILETERLFNENDAAAGKTNHEATMLLNHKTALLFIAENPTYVTPLTIARVEDIHSILIKDLGVDRNIRKRKVGISGTNYKPLDNEHQIKEALHDMCVLINSRTSIFEKALLVLVLISYIQAFGDGNKRTARILCNAMLMSAGYCPISFRTVDSLEYKKAMILFYEQNNITAMKKLFMGQFEFAVNTYF